MARAHVSATICRLRSRSTFSNCNADWVGSAGIVLEEATSCSRIELIGTDPSVVGRARATRCLNLTDVSPRTWEYIYIGQLRRVNDSIDRKYVNHVDLGGIDCQMRPEESRVLPIFKLSV